MKSRLKCKNFFVVLVCVAALGLTARAANGRTITVRLDGTGDYTTIQDAIDDCNDGDEVVVADGTYTGEDNRDIDFGGRAITVRSETGPESCIIDCNGTWENKHRGFFFHNAEDANSVLDGFTITNGYEGYGGGIYCDESNPTIINCTVTNNVASDDIGGGIFCLNSSPTITNSTFSGNSAADGGGLCGCNGPITNCTISNNSARYGGGGLAWCNGPITNCTISSNSARYEGGGLEGCDGPITNCTISGNSARGNGGGLEWCNGPITNCTISGNFSEYDGGGLNVCEGPITNCTITGNAARERGGGLHWCKGSITNCIIWNNVSADEDSQLSNCTDPTYSCIQDWTGGEGNIDVDPLFIDAGAGYWDDNGTPAKPWDDDDLWVWVDGNYHLRWDSPCVDTGDQNYSPTPGETDIDDEPRVMGTRVDMGADELNYEGPIIGISPVEPEFHFYKGDPNTQAHVLSIWNVGIGTVNWQITEDCNWLDVFPTSGQSADDINEATLSVDISGLALGSYSCELTISDPNVPYYILYVPVNLFIGSKLFVPGQFDTIQAAIEQADNYDVVLVADGNYTGPGNKNLDFNGKAITVKSENGPNDCIIDCQNSGDGFYFQNGEGEDSVVEGFTITNGRSGVFCAYESDSSPTINNCTISNNNCGIFCDFGSNPTINNCAISDNYGSGISCEGGSPEITNCTITGNLGGIRCWGGSLKITNCTITGNSGGYEGGGIYCEGNLKINNCIINQNTAEGGGGIYCNGNITITNCTITGNSAQYIGGVWCGGELSPTITNCIISNNSAGWIGGIGCWGGTTITNCTITGNSANKGDAGLSCWFGDLTITNCTITGNTTGEYGGGISCYHSSPIITNCIIWANQAPDGPQIHVDEYSNASVSYTNVQGGQADVYVEPGGALNWGLGNIDLDPWFVESGYWDANSTPDDANDDFWVDGDYHLLEDSPCIDAGMDAGVYTDIEGSIRPFDYPNVDNNGELPEFDMGAYEATLADPVELLAELTQDVIALMNLHWGIANSLLAKLDTALQKLEDANEKNDIAAVNLLQAFINAIEAQRGKKIPEADADALIAVAQAIIDLLR